MYDQLKTWGNIRDLNELIANLSKARDQFGGDIPIECFCSESIKLELMQDDETDECYLSIDADD